MQQPIAFDTLSYAKMLKEKGVENSESHAEVLAEVIPRNIYMKYEVDSMIEAVFKRFDERTAQLEKQMIEYRLEAKRDMLELEARLERKIDDFKEEFNEKISKMNTKIIEINNQTVHRLTVNLGIMTAFLTTAIAVSHFLH